MLPSQRYRIQQYQTPQCCLIDIFDKKNIKKDYHQRNSNGFIIQNKKLINNQNKFKKKLLIQRQKTQQNGGKRSISALKNKKRQTKRQEFQVQSVQQKYKSQRNSLKFISSSVDAQLFQKCRSPQPQRYTQKNIQTGTSNLINNKNITICFQPNYFTPIQKKPNLYFKQIENRSIPLEFTKKTAQLNNFNTIRINSQKNIQNNYISTYQKQKIIQNPQSLLIKKGNQQKLIEISRHFKKPQYLNQSVKFKNNQLRNIEEASRQQSKHIIYQQQEQERKSNNNQNDLAHTQTHLTEGIKPFQHIQSYIVEVKKPIQSRNQYGQKQFDSIKTKGRPVESMLYMSRDLAKTKKLKKKPLNFDYSLNINTFQDNPERKGMKDLQNITVTSQYDQQDDDQLRQRIQQSAVMMNFFNPPKHYKEKLQLSRSKNFGFQ